MWGCFREPSKFCPLQMSNEDQTFSLLVIEGGSSQHIVGEAIPGLVVLGYIKKQDSWAWWHGPVIPARREAEADRSL